jgi:hypothetical protein
MQILKDYRDVVLPAGTYYIGDLCYPLGDSWIYRKAWGETSYETPSFFRSELGCVVVDGTAYGDGSYEDNNGKTYLVDAGVISIVSIELIENHRKYLVEEHNKMIHNPSGKLITPTALTINNIVKGGHVFTFKNDVYINFSRGVFRARSDDVNVRIDTAPEWDIPE